MTKAKICGLTKKEDALFAAHNGADAIGVVNVRESKRYVKLSDAREIFRAMPPFVSRVIVASPAGMSEVKEIERTGADYLQLHSIEDVMFIKEIRENTRMGLIKQLPVTGRESIEQAELYSGLVDAILLDTKTKGSMGGTGVVHDWNISREIAEHVKKPVILAGGLNPANVLDAITKVRPYAVDVASGVEISPGIKDMEKIKQFLLNVKKV
ncbi:MAG: phosphoribosylanthranilate isomerase [Candidatus Altiarchaeia archaeon]